MNRKIRHALITVVSVMLIALCLSVGVTASKGTVGTVSKLKSTVTATSVTLKWNKAKNAKGYQVSVKNGKKWKTVATVTSTTCKINKLKAGSKYTYRVKAYSKNGKKKVWAKKTKNISVLTAPKKVSGLKGSISGKTATLKWKKTTGATAYRVYQYNSAKKKWVELKKTTSLKTTVKKLEAGKTYKFAVKAYIKKDKLSALSSSYATVSLTVKPDNISALKVTGKTDSSVTLSWQKAKGATAYAVYKYNTSNGKWTTLISSTKNTAVTVGKLSPDTSYIFSVRAITKVGKTSHYSSKYMQISAMTNKKVTTPPAVKPVTLKVPVSKTEIVSAFNKAINEYRAYKGRVTLNKVETWDLNPYDLPAALEKTITVLFESLSGTSDETYTFENGVVIGDPGIRLTQKIIPYDRPANIQASGIASAAAKANADGGYTMTLVFAPETAVFIRQASHTTTVPTTVPYTESPYTTTFRADTTTANYSSRSASATVIPVHHMSAMDPLDFGTLDLGPLKIQSADFQYPSTTIKATVDNKGRLIKLEQEHPFNGTISCKMIISLSIPLKASADNTYTITYGGTSVNNNYKPTGFVPTTNYTTTIGTPTSAGDTVPQTTGVPGYYEPVSLTTDEIAVAYNKAVNDLKEYKGYAQIFRSETLNIQTTYVSKALAISYTNSMANNAIENSNNITEGIFENGTGTCSLNSYIIPYGRKSEIAPSDLYSAKAEKEWTGAMKYTLVLKSETATFDGTSKVNPVYHKKITDIPFYGNPVNSATIIYPGATIIIYTDPLGRLESLDMTLPTFFDLVIDISPIGEFTWSAEQKDGLYYQINYDRYATVTLPVQQPVTTTVYTTERHTEHVTYQPYKSLDIFTMGYNELSGHVYIGVEADGWIDAWKSKCVPIEIYIDGNSVTTNCTVPSEPKDGIYEIIIDIPDFENLPDGAVVEFTLPDGLVETRNGLQRSTSYSASAIIQPD
ncbi:MAG: fibronectin type III domain-containing protein [Clostridia bacterium]|nr:fibronectin type III domain-containing protein [Clostridia bacterium]